METEIATCIRKLLNKDKIRFVNSGTEAEERNSFGKRVHKSRKIIKFRGCYHGHLMLFIQAGSGAVLLEVQAVWRTKGTAEDTLLADFNNLEEVIKIFDDDPEEIAAVINRTYVEIWVVLLQNGFWKD